MIGQKGLEHESENFRSQLERIIRYLSRAGTHMAARVYTWGPPDENVVLVDDITALKKAVHDEMERIGCGLHQYRVVAYG